jgi:hypothetical protein
MPVKAGIQGVVILDSRLRGNDMREQFVCLQERVSRETGFETSPPSLVVGLVNYSKGKSMASWMEDTGLTIW